MKKCIIAGAGFGFPKEFHYDADDYLIAADGGLGFFAKRHIIPQTVIGDLDSVDDVIDDIPLGGNIPTELMVYPMDKDDTDMALAIKKGKELGYTDFLILGGQGGRPDHFYANLQIMKKMAEDGLRVFLYGEEFQITVVHNDTFVLPKTIFHQDSETIQNVSVFSMNEEAHGVTIKGAKYEVDRIDLFNSYPLGVSNSYCGEDIVISVEDGFLLVMWQGDMLE